MNAAARRLLRSALVPTNHRALLASLILGLSVTTAAAGPSGMVVHDDRFADLGMTPSLGRGYSPAANTMHSVCFDTMPTTRASFDFDYVLEELDEKMRAGAQDEVADFLRDNARTTVINEGGTRRHVHYLLATLTVDSYYAAIDESTARLSEGTLALLRNGDVLGFFGGCGTHYLRSISRRSQFFTLFSYSSTEGTRDPAFERRLEHLVSHFDADGVESSDDKELAGKFDVQARSYNLRTVSRSIGLVAQNDAKLIPFDLESYRTAIAEAFKASQNEYVGRILAVELSSWLTNPTVLSTLELATSETAEGGRYERRQRLADNADVHAEMTARVRRVEQLMHRARLCRRTLAADMLDDAGVLRPEFARANVVNHRTGERLLLASLVEALADPAFHKLDEAARADTSATSELGAGRCIAELERGGLVDVSHRTIPACATPDPRLPGATLVDDYCMPELGPSQIVLVYSPDKQGWIEEVVPAFDASHPEIEVTLIALDSAAAAGAILAGTERPTVWSPGDRSVADELARDWKAANGSDPFTARPATLVTTPRPLMRRALVGGRRDAVEHPAVIFATEWVNAAERAGAERLVAFLRGAWAQAEAKKYGLAPAGATAGG